MKRIRLLLSAIAIILAVGGALAAEIFRPLMIGYEYVDRPFPQTDLCIQKLDICDTSGDWDCKVNSAVTTPVLRDASTPATFCGAPLKRHTAPPAP